ncbi:MAG: hypothetical protein JSV89_13060 [Spirochaetaceae bacterium]|nr:MAG: hypothetical protein JSV89_13060 [Spirochaetaceae bacterium]
MKKLLFLFLLLIGGAMTLQAVEIPVSIAMDESLPYRKEFRYYLVRAITDIENVKIVESGQGDWFRIHVLLVEMKLANEVSLGYAISFSIVEIPFYLHSYIFENIDAGKRQEVTDKLIKSTVFYRGSDMIVVDKASLESGTTRIHTSLKKLIEERIRSQSE